MKKSDLILIGVVLIIVVLAMFSSKGTKAYEEVEYPLSLVGEVGLHQINFEEYSTFVENNEAFIVIIERAGCSYCIQYMPIVSDVANEKNIPI